MDLIITEENCSNFSIKVNNSHYNENKSQIYLVNRFFETLSIPRGYHFSTIKEIKTRIK